MLNKNLTKLFPKDPVPPVINIDLFLNILLIKLYDIYSKNLLIN